MRFSSRTWSLLSLMLFIAAAYFWLKGNELQERRRKARENAASPTNNKTSAKIDLLSPQAARTPLAQLIGAGNATSANNHNVSSDKAYPFRLRNTTRDLNALIQDDKALLLANALIDTATGKPIDIPEHLKAKADPGSYIVQWSGPTTPEFRDRLSEAGAEIISYVPNNAYLVKVQKAGADNLAASPGVQTVLPFEPYYKISSSLLQSAVEQTPLEEGTLLRLTLIPGKRTEALQDMRALKATVLAEETSPFGPQLVVQPETSSLPKLAQLPSIQGIEPDRARIPANDLSRVTLGVATNGSASNYLNLSGSNIWVNFNDVGVDTNHVALKGRVFVGYGPMGGTDVDGHGTFVAGMIAGDGSSSPTPVPGSETNASFRGMAPLAKLLALPLDSGEDVYPKVEDTYLIETAARSNYLTFNRTNSLISNNSWTYGIRDYDTAAARYDAAVRDSLPGALGSQPLLFVFAAGNSGFGDDNGGGGEPNTIESPATAKNVITVGALEQARFITNFYVLTNITTNEFTSELQTNYSTNYPFIALTDSSDSVASFSARGNVGPGLEGNFGRFKPDVVAPGMFIVSARSKGWNITNVVDTNTPFGQLYADLHTNLTEYRYDSGTTFSAANISGMLALIQEYYETQAPTPLKGSLTPALMKALLINGARSITANYDIAAQSFLNQQGWGLPGLPAVFPSFSTNAHASLDEKHWRLRYVDQAATNALATGQSKTWNVTLTTNASGFPFRITLVWTDPPGNPIVSVKLVNDLDLVVTNLDTGAVFYGNNIPPGTDFTDPSFPQAGGASVPDPVNNVENVLIGRPADFGRKYSVTVRARRVNVNSVNNYLSATGRTNDVVQDFALVVSSSIGENPALNTPDFDFREEEVFETFDSPTKLDFDARRGLTVITNGLPLLAERVGANASLIGTNGVTNQWNFYVFTNIFVPNNFANITNGTNVAFVIFDPPNLARPRNIEADIDLYVSQDSRLTNLEPSVVAAAFKGVEREGSEMVVFTNARVALDSIYYVGVKSEDQQASEFSLIGISTQGPLDEDQNGKRHLTAVPFSDFVPDGSATRPAASTMIAIGLSDRRVQRIVATNTISHQNLGDLVGLLRHKGITAVLNNHTLNDGLYTGTNTIVYNDYDPTAPEQRRTDGPGGLNDFVGEKITGPWIFQMIDNAPGHTGRVELLTLTIDPLQNPLLSSESVRATNQPNQTLFFPIDVPPGVTNLTFRFTDVTPGLLDVAIQRGALPNLSPTNQFYEFRTNITSPGGEFSFPTTNNLPLTPGTYYLAVRSPNPPNTIPVEYTITVFFGYDTSPGNEFHFEGPGPLVLDDATTNTVIDITADKVVAGTEVSIRMGHPRIADTVLHLVSPQGTRILLAENRGQTNSVGMGMDYTVTNIFGVPSSERGYAVFTEDTNKTDLPIKFALPPFANIARNTGFVFTNGFEGATNGTYNQGELVDGWLVETNQVQIIADPARAFEGTNFVLLGKVAPPQTPVTLGLGSPTATFSQTYGANFSVATMRDAITNNNFGWAISPDGGPNANSQTAVFETTQNIGFTNGTLFNFTFYFYHNSPVLGGHNLGRFRLSVTSDPQNTFADGLPTGGDVVANWTPIDPISLFAQSGATLSKLDDDSILASGFAPEHDVYRVVTYTRQTNITGLRLEALKDSSLPFGGPGRQTSNGNFVLTEMTVTMVEADLPGAISQQINTTERTEYEIRFVAANPKAFNDPNGLPVDGNLVIDGITNRFIAGTNWTANSFKFVAHSNLTTVALSADAIPVWVDRVEIIETGNRYYLPEESLALLEGERAIGEWRLELTDNKTGAAVPLPDVFSWKLDLQFANPLILAEPLFSNVTYPRATNNLNKTNIVVPGTLFTNQTHYFMVQTCPGTTLATVTLMGITNIGQVEMLIDRSGIPTGNPETDDYVPLLNTDRPGGTKNGSATFTFTTSSPASAPLQPGKPFFIAVRNRSVNTTNSYKINIRLDNSSCLPRQSTRLNNAQSQFSMLSMAAGAGAPPDSEGELYSVEVAPGTSGFSVDVSAEGDVAILARKDSPPTTQVYSHIQDVAGSGDEQLTVDTTSTTPLTPGTWYVLVLNKESYPVAYDVLATNPLGPILTAKKVSGRVQVSWLGINGIVYNLQTSTDLIQWTQVQSFTGRGTTITYLAPASTETARFYRISPQTGLLSTETGY